MRIPIPFAGNHGVARSVKENNQITQNLYPEVTKDGKAPAVLYRIPGLASAFIGGGACRSNGALFGDKLYFVSGSGLYEVDVGGTATLVGTLGTTSGRVSIIEGQTYLMMVDGVNGYTWDGTTFATIVDAVFVTLTPSFVAYKDGFFCVVDEGSGNFYVSELEDPTVWPALDFANAEGRPDILKAIQATDDFLYLLGDYSTEAWFNAGGPVFPFKRAQGGVSSWGIRAIFSIAEADNSIFYLGRIREGGHEVVRTTGTRVEVISTPEISNEINALESTDDAFAFTYLEGSHHFYVLTFVSAQKTFVFDMTTGLWHTRHSKTINRWRPNGHGFFNNTHYVGDGETGQFYSMDLGTYTDGGDFISCIRTTPPIHKNYQAITFNELILDVEGGLITNKIVGPVEGVNLCSAPETIDAWGSGTATVVPNNDSAPDGTGTADTVTDSSGAATQDKTFALVNAATTFTYSLFVKKDSDETRFPAFVAAISGGAVAVRLVFNTKTGASVTEIAGGALSVTSEVIDYDSDYWRARITLTNPGATIVTTMGIYPAWASTLTITPDVTATGSVVAWGGVITTGSALTDYKVTTYEDQQILMRYSDDGGKTWSDELEAQIGKLGEYKFKAYWHQLGDSYERTFEFKTVDSAFTAWLGAYAQVQISDY